MEPYYLYRHRQIFIFDPNNDEYFHITLKSMELISKNLFR